MKIKKIKLIIVFSIFVLFASYSGLLGAGQALAENYSGIYKTSYESAIIIPLKEGQKCEPPNKIDGKLCIYPYIADKILGVFQDTNGDIFFNSHIAFYNGNVCSPSGQAVAKDGGWVHTDSQSCMIKISVKEGQLVMNPAKGEACNHICGSVLTYYQDIKFPLSSKMDAPIQSKGDIEYMPTTETPSFAGEITGE